MSVLKQIDKIGRDFLWSAMDGTHKYCLVEWNKTCSPLDQGGLGIKALREVNKAFLAKWLWRYGQEPKALWRRVIVAKYKSHAFDWFSEEPKGSFGLSFWKDIFMEMESFKSGIGYKVGRGNKVSF